jgi:hypothetical protein
VEEGNSNHIPVVFESPFRVHVLHRKDHVGVLGKIDHLIFGVLHLAHAAARQNILLILKHGNDDSRLVAIFL